jgi:hypothetical protein
MLVHIPLRYFGPDESDWLIWATSHKGTKQIDHVGRSLRTQNPRFELLNTLHPSRHKEAITEEHSNPSLMRDLFLRLGFDSYFAYREWDFVPDVMIYTSRYPVGFPNGRLLKDDVAAILAQHGDTLLLELSHHNAQWPRVEDNYQKGFSPEFPYLAEPWSDPAPTTQHNISSKNMLILVVLGLCLLLVFLLALAQTIRIVRRWLGFGSRECYL